MSTSIEYTISCAQLPKVGGTNSLTVPQLWGAGAVAGEVYIADVGAG